MWNMAQRWLPALTLVGATLLSHPAQLKAQPLSQSLYNPIPFPSGGEVNDRLSERDIPTGQGGFARDYRLTLTEGDQVAIDVLSDSFDTVVTLMDESGNPVGENDDGPDGTTNSLLFTRISQTGSYIVRVRSFSQGGNGDFQLKVTRLRPI